MCVCGGETLQRPRRMWTRWWRNLTGFHPENDERYHTLSPIISAISAINFIMFVWTAAVRGTRAADTNKLNSPVASDATRSLGPSKTGVRAAAQTFGTVLLACLHRASNQLYQHTEHEQQRRLQSSEGRSHSH